jgi:hypothetical protein
MSSMMAWLASLAMGEIEGGGYLGVLRVGCGGAAGERSGGPRTTGRSFETSRSVRVTSCLPVWLLTPTPWRDGCCADGGRGVGASVVAGWIGEGEYEGGPG